MNLFDNLVAQALTGREEMLLRRTLNRRGNTIQPGVEFKANINPASIPTIVHDHGLEDIAQVLPAHLLTHPMRNPITPPIAMPTRYFMVQAFSR